MNRILILAVLSLCLPAFSYAGSITLSTEATLDSSMVVSGQLDDGAKWLWLRIQKADDPNPPEDVFPVLSGENFSKTLYLRKGTGLYTISAYQKMTDPQYGTGYYLIHTFSVANQDPKDETGLLPSDWVQSNDPKIVALAHQITDPIDGDLQKSLALHDWVSSHVAYDTVSLYAQIARNYSASETLTTLLAFCSGYANLNAALHRAVGLPAKVLTGNANFMNTKQLHAWNEVLIGGRWVIEDPTWDAGGLLGTNFVFRLSHVYFDPSAENFAKDHEPGTDTGW